MSDPKPLAGWRVLVPRGGTWGDAAAATLRGYGAVPVIAPLINFASAEDPSALANALHELQDGQFDWLVVTSATTVDVLTSQGTKVPDSTRIAAVGETTGAALQLGGFRVDFVPHADNSARGLVKEWPASDIRGRVLIPQSDIAEPTLVAGLSKLGFAVEYVTAYRTVGVPVAPNVAADLASGRIRGVLVTSGSVARQLAEQLPKLPDETVIACIGPRTAFDARAAGLPVHVIAEERTADSLIAALVDYAVNENVRVSPGSGTVPRAFAFAVLGIVSVFVAVWLSSDRGALALALALEALAVLLAARSLFVGVLLAPDAIVVRGWFRDFRYARGGLQAVTPVPYWKFLGADDPILSLLKFTPEKGWVREISTTVAWRDRTATHAARIREHLGVPSGEESP